MNNSLPSDGHGNKCSTFLVRKIKNDFGNEDAMLSKFWKFKFKTYLEQSMLLGTNVTLLVSSSVGHFMPRSIMLKVEAVVGIVEVSNIGTSVGIVI